MFNQHRSRLAALSVLAVARRVLSIGLLSGLFGISAHPAMAQNLVTNGTFAVTGGTTSFQFGSGFSYSETLAGWATTGYNFVFLPGSTTAAGSAGSLSLWSPVTGAANGFTNASPTGGNFVAADGDYQTFAITQTINGLAVGRTYAVSFAWAAAQQSGFTGATTEAWQVSLGGSSNTTTTYNNPSQGFSGWMNQTYNYVATSTSEVLSFLAIGSPAVPPFALLANVSVTQVPEPASVAVVLTGLAGLLMVARRRRSAMEIFGDAS